MERVGSNNDFLSLMGHQEMGNISYIQSLLDFNFGSLYMVEFNVWCIGSPRGVRKSRTILVYLVFTQHSKIILGTTSFVAVVSPQSLTSPSTLS